MHSLLLNLSLNGQKYKTEKEKRIYFCQKCRLAKALPQWIIQVKEIKRQSRAVKVTHPPAGGGNFTSGAASQVQ